MKKILLTLLLLAGCNLIIFAQCSKKIIWTASKADVVDEGGNVQDTKNVKIVIHTSDKEIRIIHSDDETDTLHGTVKADTCEWKEPFRNGKTIFKADLSEKNADYSDCLVMIEGKDGKILISIKLDTPDGKKVFKIPVDAYKEEQ